MSMFLDADENMKEQISICARLLSVETATDFEKAGGMLAAVRLAELICVFHEVVNPYWVLTRPGRPHAI
jgi:hypothetical protein